MLFTCDFCRAPVRPGLRVCHRERCQKLEVERQTVLKCEELGLNYAFPPRRLGP